MFSFSESWEEAFEVLVAVEPLAYLGRWCTPPPFIDITPSVFDNSGMPDADRVVVKPFSFEKVTVEGGVLLRLAGRIDETMRQDIVEGLHEVVILDMNGVQQFTSFGVRAWLALLGKLNAKYVGFINCRPATTTQFNSISRFAGKGELVTFFAPYSCPSCGKMDEILLDLRRDYAIVRSLTPPERSCVGCGARTELDDIPESFFQYPANAPQPNPPPVALQIIDGKRASGTGMLRISKDVQETFTAVWLSGSLGNGTQLRRTVDGLEGQVLVVASGLQATVAPDVSLLAPLLNLPGADVVFSRLPVEIAQRIADSEKGFGNAKVCSLLMPALCSKCQLATNVECDASQVASGNYMGSCSMCGSNTVAESTAIGRRRLNHLPTVPFDPALRTYLEEHGQATDLLLRPEERSTRVGQKYEIESALGMGGMAEVFLARQKGAGGFEKRVAVKRILSHLSKDPTFVEMFLGEAKTAAKINHPNVVQTFDVEESAGQYLIAMEYVEGLNLEEAIRIVRLQKKQIPLAVGLKMTADICAGLQAAHTATGPNGQISPIIHRDVSPHNVLVSKRGVAKLSDFGIAKAEDAQTRTPLHTVKGKVSYLAPEQIQGTGEASVASDIFAAGVVLYLCMTTVHPFQRPTEGATIHAILDGSFQPCSAVRVGLPPFVDEIVSNALAREARARFTSAGVMQRALEAGLVSLGEASSEAAVERWVNELLGSEARKNAKNMDSPRISGEVTPIIRSGTLGG